MYDTKVKPNFPKHSTKSQNTKPKIENFFFQINSAPRATEKFDEPSNYRTLTLESSSWTDLSQTGPNHLYPFYGLQFKIRFSEAEHRIENFKEQITRLSGTNEDRKFDTSAVFSTTAEQATFIPKILYIFVF